MLIDVINYVKRVTGAKDRASILADINIAWKTIWNSQDLPGSQWTDFIQPDVSTGTAAMPDIVQELRGMRRWNGPMVTLNSPVVYMGEERWMLFPFEGEVVGESALKSRVTNAAPLIISIGEPSTEDINIILIGQTSTSAKVREEVTITAGETEAETVNSFLNVYHFGKDKIYPLDVKATDAMDVELAEIPADALFSRYVLVKLREPCESNLSQACYVFKILFKRRAPLLWNDEDPILEPFDVALQDAVVALILKRGKDPNDQAQSARYANDAAAAFATLGPNKKLGENVPIKFVSSPMFTTYRGWI